MSSTRIPSRVSCYAAAAATRRLPLVLFVILHTRRRDRAGVLLNAAARLHWDWTAADPDPTPHWPTVLLNTGDSSRHRMLG